MPYIQAPNDPANSLTPNIRNAQAVTKSDSTVFTIPTVGLYIGGTGDVAVRMAGGQNNVTFSSFPAGQILPVACDQVLSTGTTATNIVRMW